MAGKAMMAVAVVVRSPSRHDIRRHRHSQQAAAAFQLGRPPTISEKSIMADSVKAVGQYIEPAWEIRTGR
jgi:hypothetical protein